jgi:hypothetical protein
MKIAAILFQISSGRLRAISKYTNKQSPTFKSQNSEMKNWLRKGNIPYSNKKLKSQMHKLIPVHKSSHKKFSTDACSNYGYDHGLIQPILAGMNTGKQHA